MLLVLANVVSNFDIVPISTLVSVPGGQACFDHSHVASLARLFEYGICSELPANIKEMPAGNAADGLDIISNQIRWDGGNRERAKCDVDTSCLQFCDFK